MGPVGVKVNAIKQLCPCPAFALSGNLRPKWCQEKAGEEDG